MPTRKNNAPKLATRAQFQPATLNDADRTVELIWTTPAPVQRGGWFTAPYNEVLGMKPENVRLDRLNGGAPLLNNHDQDDLSDVIGVVEKAWMDGDQGRALVRFPKAEDDPEADQIYRKVKDGIIRNVSVGYVVHEYDENGGAPEGEIPTWIAIDWEPMELSLVCVPADAGAGVRSEGDSENKTKMYPFKLRSKNPKEDSMPPENNPAPVDEKEIARKAQTDERKRVSEITTLARKHNVEADVMEKFVTEGNSVEEVRAAILDLHLERGSKPALAANPVATIVVDEREKTRAAMEEALEFRANPKSPLTDMGRDFVGMSLREMARESLRRQGIKTTGLGPMQLAERALHTTSDFPAVLANIANKSLRRGYEESPATYDFLTNEVEVPDFKQISRVQMGDGPAMEKVPEQGEFKRGTFGDSAEKYQVETWGKIVGITRQALVNDDLNSFTRIPENFGKAARSLISDTVWGIISNGLTILMADGNALFSNAHGNIAAGNASIMAALPAMRAMMKKQVGTTGRVLNLQPKYLVVGVGRETEAEGVISPLIMAQQASNVNTFARTLSIIAEPRLGDVPFLLVADKNQIDIIEIAYLQGQRGVYTEQRMGFDVDGLEIKARMDFGVKAIDWRGLVRNAGA